jgi:hypothetical protein
MAMEWTIAIEGRNEVGEVCRKQCDSAMNSQENVAAVCAM